MSHLWTFLTKKNKDIYVEKIKDIFDKKRITCYH
mgnify:FL=1